MSSENYKRVRDLIQEGEQLLAAAGIDSPKLDAEILLAHALAITRTELLLNPRLEISPFNKGGKGDFYERYKQLITRRTTHEPIAYIIGHQEFWGLDFVVAPDVLIPRPDTETLVEEAIKLLEKNPPTPFVKGGIIIDVCTGSGCVAIAIAHERRDVEVWAVDISQKALEVAQENVEKHGLAERVHLVRGDLLDAPLPSVSLIVGNPPYIKPNDFDGLQTDVRDFEPSLALVGESLDGLGHHRRILQQARSILSPGGHLMLEIGFDQGDLIRQMSHDGFGAPRIVKDYGGNDRVATWQRLAE